MAALIADGHRAAEAPYVDPDTWCGRHKPQDGSWWQKWTEWLARKGSGKMVSARVAAGDDGSDPSLSPAPGLYVMQR